MLQTEQETKEQPRPRRHSRGAAAPLIRPGSWLLIAPLAIALAGCGAVSGKIGSKGALTVSPGTLTIDTNCTGCSDSAGKASSTEQFTATVNGSAANVTWSVSPNKGAGSIDSSGQYTPPLYLTADTLKATITATLTSNSSTTASATLTITPGFLQPLSPENIALGSSSSTTITGVIAEAGGSAVINFALSGTANGSGGGQGALVAAPCTRSANTFTTCKVTYTAPAAISSTAATYVVGTIDTSSSKDSTEVLLNTAGVNSDPTTHEAQLPSPVSLGSSGGNNDDYDSSGGHVQDCCGGTLGALIQDSGGNKYILSNNHVLARSDQADPSAHETIIQPGLVDDGCIPYGSPGNAVMPVGTLTGWLALSSSSTNADAAIAKIDSGAVDPNGSILELGAMQPGGTLAADPPGTSSTGGQGEAPAVNMTVAKSGRTTGLTCASISATNLSVQVDYFKDCGETQPYITKTYKNQIEITGNQFTDAGDSGSLVVNTSNGEPVGLFFAGGVDQAGQSESVASPAPDVLNELHAQLGGTYTYVGTADHLVTCLNYGAGTVALAQARTLTGPQLEQAQTALGPARQLVNPSLGILGVATGKSSDEPGAGAVLVYVNPGSAAGVPATIGGVRTVVIPTTASAVAAGAAPLTPFAVGAAPALPAAALNHAVAIKESLAANLMKQNPAFFGVGVGQSYDDPTQAALVVFVDRNNVPASLPATIGGLRTRYIIMSRLHVTRAYDSPIPTRSRCLLQSRRSASQANFSPQNLLAPRPLPLQ